MREHQDKLMKLGRVSRRGREEGGLLPVSSPEGFATETMLFSGLGLSGDLAQLGKLALEDVYLRLKSEDPKMIEDNRVKRTELVGKMGDLLGDQNKVWTIHFEIKKSIHLLVGQYEHPLTLQGRGNLGAQVGREVKRIRSVPGFEELAALSGSVAP